MLIRILGTALGTTLASTLRSTVGTAVVAFALVAGTANAASVDLRGALGAQAASTGSIVDSDVGTITFDANPFASVVTYDAGSGLGVDCRARFSFLCAGDNRYQIDFQEVLAVSFEDDVFVESIDVSNLYWDRNWFIGFVPERGGVATGFGLVFFDATDATDGDLTVDVGVVTSQLRIFGRRGYTNDYSLAGLAVDAAPGAVPGPGIDPGNGNKPVPEPGAALLFGLGGLFVSMTTRRV